MLTVPTTPLSATDEAILLLLGRLGYLTNQQLVRRMGLTLRWVQALTAKLERLGYVQRIEGTGDGRGSLPDVFRLDTEGITVLAALGALAKGRTPRAAERPKRLTFFMRHTLAINDVLIACELVTGERELFEYWHERDIARMVTPVKPDAWIRFSVGADDDHVYLLEVDLATEEQRQFRKKVAGLCTLINDPRRLDRLFGTDQFYAVLVVAETTKRLEQLEAWVVAELRTRRQPYLADAFRYATLSAASDPTWLAAHI